MPQTPPLADVQVHLVRQMPREDQLGIAISQRAHDQQDEDIAISQRTHSLHSLTLSSEFIDDEKLAQLLQDFGHPPSLLVLEDIDRAHPVVQRGSEGLSLIHI